MAVSVVQSAKIENAGGVSPLTGTFGANVTAANTVLLGFTTFSASNVAISTSAPTLGGSSVTGATKIAEVQSAYTASLTAYAAIWLLPAVTGGSTGFGLSITNGVTANHQIGLMAWEVAGLGATPVLDQSSASSGASTSATSGTTSATTVNDEIILGVLVGLDGLTGTPTSPAGYTNLTITNPGDATAGGYQIQTASGSTYTYANANAGSDVWAGAIVTVCAPSGGTNAPAALAAATGVPPSGTADALTIGMTIRGS